jgi:hypothetical protein
MTDRFLFDDDPLTGERQWFIPDESAGTFTIHTEQNVDAIVEANKQHFNQFSSARTPWGDKIGASTLAARIPTSVYFALVKKFGPARHNPEAWKRWLNDPDNAAFRTRPGTVCGHTHMAKMV